MYDHTIALGCVDVDAKSKMLFRNTDGRTVSSWWGGGKKKKGLCTIRLASNERPDGDAQTNLDCIKIYVSESCLGTADRGKGWNRDESIESSLC